MIKRFTKRLILAAALVTTISCSTPPKEAAPTKLDIKAYLEAGEQGAIYPSEQQLDMLSALIPDRTYIPIPTIDDRQFWDSLARTENGKRHLAEAYELIDKIPEVPITDEIYRKANKEGNRAIYKPRYYRTMDRLEKFILAECIENRRKFLDQIEIHSHAILSMKSWLHPNHDDSENSVLEGKRMAIDLGARKFGLVLALADVTLKDRVPPELRKKINGHLKRRITDSYLASCAEENPVSNSWIRSTSNWNSVCTSGSVFTIIVNAQDKMERTVAIGSALNSMEYYLSGFGEDGYCSEGTGYWNYGFGHYLYLAEILYDYTDGMIDLFEFDNPEKLKRVASFPRLFQIHDGLYAPFADGVTSVAVGTDNFAYLMAAKHYGANKPTYFMPDESVATVIGWRDAAEFVDPSGNIPPLPPATHFDDFGIVISRGTAPTPISIAIKAGHNAENHNHSDVGSYYIVFGEEGVAGDIGAPSYMAGAFDDDNPARSSWGHPVPRVNGELQSNGIEFKGEVTSTSFTEDLDIAKLNIKEAYKNPQLQFLERTMTNEKAGAGQITITDEFKASEAIDFGTAIMVNVDYKIRGDQIIINSGKHSVRVVVEAEGGEIKITDEVVPVEHLRSGKRSYRIGIDFTEPLLEGKISVKYLPIS